MKYFLDHVKLPDGTNYYCDSYSLEIEIDNYAIQMHKEFQKSQDYIIKIYRDNVECGFSTINGKEIEYAKSCLNIWLNQIIEITKPESFYVKLKRQLMNKFKTIMELFS